MQSAAMTTILHRIEREGAVTLRGLHVLGLARSVLDEAVRAAGYSITFDPGSAADLVDYLTIGAGSALQGAAIGGGFGGLIGLLFGCTGWGAVIGAGIGLVAGTARGVGRVQQGWRVRAVREIDGTPCITISAS